MGRNTFMSLGSHLRLLEEEENRLLILKNSIQQGLDSGRADNFDPNEHLNNIKLKRKSNG